MYNLKHNVVLQFNAKGMAFFSKRASTPPSQHNLVTINNNKQRIILIAIPQTQTQMQTTDGPCEGWDLELLDINNVCPLLSL
jgi:hypothetical protein